MAGKPIYALGVEIQCLKWHRELQGSHRRANGAKILFFFENKDFRRCSFSGFFFFSSSPGLRISARFRNFAPPKKNRFKIDGFSIFCEKTRFGHIFHWFSSRNTPPGHPDQPISREIRPQAIQTSLFEKYASPPWRPT